MRPLSILSICALATVALALPASAQTGANVLLVANTKSADSLRVAEAYARARSVPQDQVLRIAVDAGADEVDRATYDRDIQTPVSDWLTDHFAHDRILYIVLTKGIPLRVKGTGGREGTTSSVDSELAVLYRRLTGATTLVPGPVPNPYYLAGAAVGQAKLFSHADHDVFLVTRLDGFTVDDVLALVERGAKPSSQGKIVLDEKAGLTDAGGDQWLKAAGDWMIEHGFGDRLVLDKTTKVVTGEKDVLGYYSWGSNDPAVSARHFDLGFVPGAIAGTFVSTDARTFREPPAGWKTATWNERTKFFAGSPQSLLGDLIRDGVTGASGYVAEPYLDATIRPNVLFPAYLSGFNLAESFYLAMPSLSWQAVIVGDPLCAPFPRKALQPSDIDKGLDPATGLPAYFSARSAKVMAAAGTRPEAATLMLRAQARKAKGDKAGAQKALEEAAAIDPRLDTAHLLLAASYEEQKEYDKAIERYRLVLANKPANPVALNNLAYVLAVRKDKPAEALAYAQRAYTVSPTPIIADTLAWVQHLVGRDQEAARLLADTARKLPENAEVRLHAAVVFAAVGMVDAAARELAVAVKLEPELEATDEVKRLRTKLK
jgi:uncharacterized protein (TIGR03790 family)